MEILKWGKEFELGIPEIDQQHKKLVDILNSFYTELAGNVDRDEAIKHFFNDLEKYLILHLKFEEEFMQQMGFDNFENHKKVHDMFIKLYKEEKERYLSGDKKALNELVALSLSWLLNHIAKTDRKYAEFYKKLNNQT
ncbi:bacteriohemerythrin [Persephonella sp.]|uniref:bacteriohemerythrin n=1 Tax=Persephonella sp. TaxID=2060922 RepID=UPI0026259B01|nr:bacteriohemerythrin [Persephonella sp.]